MNKHNDEVIKLHQKHWKKWLVQWSREDKMAGGGGLTLNGCLIKGMDTSNERDPLRRHRIAGGYLLIKAKDLEEAVKIIRDCPIYEFDGYAEIREVQP